jgi:hypothetical protein
MDATRQLAALTAEDCAPAHRQQVTMAALETPAPKWQASTYHATDRPLRRRRAARL